MCVVVNRYYHGLFGKSSLQKKMLTIRLLVTLLLCFDDDAMQKKTKPQNDDGTIYNQLSHHSINQHSC